MGPNKDRFLTLSQIQKWAAGLMRSHGSRRLWEDVSQKCCAHGIGYCLSDHCIPDSQQLFSECYVELNYRWSKYRIIDRKYLRGLRQHSIWALSECYKKNGHENYVSKLFCFWDFLQILLFWKKIRMRFCPNSHIHISQNIEERLSEHIAMPWRMSLYHWSKW